MTTPPDTPKPPAELWVVIDDVGQPEYAASYPEAAQEHINDWIENASDSTVKILGLGKYSSHRYILAPSPQESHKLAEELDAAVAFWREKLANSWAPEYRRHTETLIAAALRSSPSEQTSDARINALLDAADDWERYVAEDIAPTHLRDHLEAAIAASGGAKEDGNG